jgi:hypothetical protein
MGKKRQKKSGGTKKRDRKYAGPQGKPVTETGGGAMQSMVGGFRRAVGVEKKKRKTWADHIWTLLLLAVVGGLLLWRFT